MRSHHRKRKYCIEALERRQLLSLTVPALNSLPGAAKKLFIDFDGNPAFTWSNSTGTYAVDGGPAGSAVPGYNIDSDPNNFSATELSEINQIWQYVAEKYSPFNINVTTVDPGNRSDNVTCACIVGGSVNDWYNKPTIVGTSNINGFLDPALSNTAFSFAGDYASSPGTTRVTQVGETIAHECGHEFGLKHQRANGTAIEYYVGDGVIAPIMGNGANGTNRSIWWKTNNWPGQNSSDPAQDELSVLGGQFPVLGPRADDYPTGVFPTLALDPNGAWNPVNGIIETQSDGDGFNFSAPAGAVSFTVNNATQGGMLSPKVRIVDTLNATNVPATIDLSNPNRAAISASGLTLGKNYRLIVEGRGAYGDVGGYTVTGNANQFATFNAATGALLVSGMAGNNNIVISVEYTGASQPGVLKVTDSVNGGSVGSQTWPINSVTRIDFGLAGGNDTVRIYELHPLSGGGNGPYVNFKGGGGGTNTLILDKDDDSNQGSYHIYAGRILLDTTNVYIPSGEASSVECDGDLGSNFFYIHSWSSSAPPLTLKGFGGYGDTFTFDSAAILSAGDITVDGAGGNDTLTFDGSDLTTGQQFNFFGTEITSGQGAFAVDFSSIETVNVYGGSGGDGMGVYDTESATTLNFHGGGGNDNLYVGDSYDDVDLTSFLGPIYFYGDGGTDSAYLDDANATDPHIYIVDHTHIGAAFGSSSFGNTFNGGGVESFTINGGSTVGCTYYVYEGQPGVTLTLNGGSSSDYFNIGPADTWNMTIYGNGGFDSMTIDDRPASAASAPLQTNIHANKIEQSYGQVYFTINFTSIENPAYYAANATHSLFIDGLANEVAPEYQWTVIMGSGDDHITVHAQDFNTGVPALLAPIGIGGGYGNDDISFDSYYVTSPLNYIFYNPYGSSTCDIYGMGPNLVGVGTDIETINVYGGTNNDYFRIDTFQTGGSLNIYGYNGNDTVEFTPLTGRPDTNISSLDSFNFNGGGGTGDVLRFFNYNAGIFFNYTQTSASLLASSSNGWSLTMANTGVETLFVSSGTLTDTFSISSAPAGQTFQMTGGGSPDNVTVNAGAVEFTSSDDLGSFFIATGAAVKVSAAHAGIIVRSTLTLNGKLDLFHSDLAVDYPVGSSPIGSWNGAAYTNMTGLIRTGRNGGSWNATSGITTSGATGSLTALGIAEASQALGLTGSQTKTFDGYTVDASTVLVKFTYAGDANLDGKINVDDYIKIDGGISAGLKGWINGDFNYDGKINIDDYTLIDNNIRIQGPPMLSASSPDAIAAPKLIWSELARDESTDLLDI